MSLVRLTNFIKITKPDGTVEHCFQNGQLGGSIGLNDFDHYYLSFIYQGAAKNRTGDNLISSLVLSVNPVAMNYAYEAITNKWNVQVDTCVMNDDFTEVQKTLTTEFWVASAMSYDTTTVEIALSSSLDAVSTILPNRVFTRELVGYLPTTGSIQAR